MTPFYIVLTTDANGCLQKVNDAHTTQKAALEAAKEVTIKYNRRTYVLESIAQIELPQPEPIVTMKGD